MIALDSEVEFLERVLVQLKRAAPVMKLVHGSGLTLEQLKEALSLYRRVRGGTEELQPLETIKEAS